jgi:hypothetical protein
VEAVVTETGLVSLGKERAVGDAPLSWNIQELTKADPSLFICKTVKDVLPR